jgi:hypothetical protein
LTTVRKAPTPAARRKRRPNAAAQPPRSALDISWIRALAAPYLRDFHPEAVAHGALRGYRFACSYRSRPRRNTGFFVGYVVGSGGYEFLNVDPPECIVFAFIRSPNSTVYRDLVTPEDSLLKKTAEYIGWLTHRPPRFAFFEDREVVLVRHFSMRAWPAAKHKHYSRNFFIETLAWLVRSGLVAKLRWEKPQVRT